MSDRNADDVLRSNDCNTYVMSCHLSQEALYKAMRQDLRIACAEIAKLRAEREELRQALEDLILAVELPGDHCEIEQALPRARAALAEKGE